MCSKTKRLLENKNRFSFFTVTTQTRTRVQSYHYTNIYEYKKTQFFTLTVYFGAKAGISPYPVLWLILIRFWSSKTKLTIL